MKHANLGAVLALFSAAASAQVSSNQSLKGNFYFRQVMLITDSAANVTDTRSAWGTLTFDGSGGFTIAGQQMAGTAAPTALSGSGTYAVSPGGFASLTSPIKAGTINARLGTGALVGSSTETAAGTFDLFLAIPAPAQSTSNQTLSGAYWISSLEFPNGGSTNVRNTNFKLTANGAGGFAENSVTGQARNLGNRLQTQTVGPNSYAVSTDGTGTLTFPSTGGRDSVTQLIQGVKTIYVSQDGSYFIGGSAAAGGHGVVIGVRSFSGGATNASWNGFFFTAGLRYDTNPARLASVVGSVNATPAGSVWSRRTRQSDGLFDASPLLTYSLGADGSGTFLSTAGHVDVASSGQVFSTSGVDIVDSTSYEIYFGTRMLPQSGGNLFLHPQGILNAASFAPAGFPVSPGSYVTLFGNFGVATTSAKSFPFPTTLGNVQVLVNNTPAPIYFVSAVQISMVVPYTVAGPSATFTVTVNGVKSNSVDVPVAPTSPGVFSVSSNGIGDAAIQHRDYSLVTQSNPARPGEILQAYLAGLGAVSPAVTDGGPAPAQPLANVTAPVNVYFGGVLVTNLQFKGLTPGQANLYQINFQVPTVGPGQQSLAVQTADAFTDLVSVWVGN